MGILSRCVILKNARSLLLCTARNHSGLCVVYQLGPVLEQSTGRWIPEERNSSIAHIQATGNGSYRSEVASRTTSKTYALSGPHLLLLGGMIMGGWNDDTGDSYQFWVTNYAK